MATYDKFMSRVLPELDGCPEIVALQAIRDTAIDFCERSAAYCVDLAPVPMVANTGEYALTVPAGYRLARIMKAWFNQTELAPVAPDMLGEPTAYMTGVTGTADPQAYFQKDQSKFSVLPVPKSASGSVVMRVALKPLRDATDIDDSIFEEYADIIAAGAKHRLMMMNGKQWFNPQLSGVYKTIYDGGVNTATLTTNMGNVRSHTRTKMRRI